MDNSNRLFIPVPGILESYFNYYTGVTVFFNKLTDLIYD